jgi:zinc transporter
VKALQSAERIRGELDRGRRFASPRELLYAFLDNYPDAADRLLHRLLDQLELIEDHILDERHRNERKQLMLVRREAAQVHRHMRALRRALSHAERTLPDFPEAFTSVTRRLTGLEQDFDAMEVRAKFFHDEIDAKLASETNRQLYILSALTAAFLPPTLMAGLFGMNFSDLPWGETHGGFWTALGLCLLSSAAVWLYLWRLNRN